MSQAKQFQNSLRSHKTGCCEERLIPLMTRIEFLEKKLSEEIELRENEYNHLLRLVVKDKIQNTGNKNHKPVISIKERKSKVENRVEKSPGLENKKQALKQVLNRRVSTKTITLHKDPELVLLKRDSEVKPPDNAIALDQRMKLVEQGLEHQQNELDKIKELNQYIMDQMLAIFEKIKQLQVKEQASAKQIQSLETISSMVVQGEARQQHIKVVNNLSHNKKSDSSQLELNALISKVAEHENVLSELIQLTRQVSSQISLSPKKPKQI